MKEIILLNIFYFAIFFSILGYGFLLSFYVFKKNELRFINYGYLGIFGILFLILISYTTNLIIPHNKIHNFFIISSGLFFFFYFNKSYFLKKKLLSSILVFLILSIGFYISKTHDDFPHYHYLYISQITNYKIQFGLPWFHYGFNHHSSLFYLHSLFYLPIIEKNLFNFGPIYILGFANLVFLNKIFSYKLKKLDLIFYINLINLIFINIFFSRLSEHGTDRSASILIFLIFSLLIEFIISNEKRLITFLILLVSLNITLKSFYIIYLLIFLLLFIFFKKKNELLIFYLKSKSIIFSFFSIFYAIFFNFINNGCIIYPIAKTCFEEFSWSKSKGMVIAQMNWYEQWSKAGAGPNFRVDDPLNYIQGFNWVNNWIDRYFFYKFSDYLLGLALLSLIFLISFKSKTKIKNNLTSNKKKNFTVLFIFLTSLIFFWFIKNPDLRYGGGFAIIALFIFIPICFILSSIDNNFLNKKKIILSLIIFSFLIFFNRNIYRIYKEYVKYDYNPFLNPYYQIDKNEYDAVSANIKKIIEDFNQCKLDKQNDCSNTLLKFDSVPIGIKEFSDYTIFYKKLTLSELKILYK
jgi:hypothetical protein